MKYLAECDMAVRDSLSCLKEFTLEIKYNQPLIVSNHVANIYYCPLFETRNPICDTSEIFIKSNNLLEIGSMNKAAILEKDSEFIVAPENRKIIHLILRNYQ
jgi:hypothetical protein